LIDGSGSTLSWMKSPTEYIQRLTVECNYLVAVQQIDLDDFIPDNCVAIDLGCGGGWLSAHLSRFHKVEKILSIDTSLNYLSNFVPQVAKLMDGDPKKIETIQGHFYPLVLEDSSIDLVLISSAAHHASDLEALLTECYRVLRQGGYVLILNETPSNEFRFFIRSFKEFTRLTIFNLLRRYRSLSVTTGVGRVLYDPNLGDIDYSLWFWKKAISAAGLKLSQVHNSRLPTVAGGKSHGHPLSHFVCVK